MQDSMNVFIRLHLHGTHCLFPFKLFLSKHIPILLPALALAWARRVPADPVLCLSLAGLARGTGDALSFLQFYSVCLCLYPLYCYLIYQPVGKNNLTLHQEKKPCPVRKKVPKVIMVIIYSQLLCNTTHRNFLN